MSFPANRLVHVYVGGASGSHAYGAERMLNCLVLPARKLNRLFHALANDSEYFFDLCRWLPDSSSKIADT